MTPDSTGSLSVAVVICAYTLDRWDDVCAAYDSLAVQTRPADEVVLVIDHNPALQQKLTTRYPAARIVSNAGVRGLSDGRNTGVRATTADVVLFLDDDARAEPTWIAELVDCVDRPAVQGVAGSALPAWDQPGRPSWFPEEFLWVVGCSYRGLPTERAEVRNPIGSSMGFRREALERVGGFSSVIGRVGTHPVGCEETELSIRVRQGSVDAHIVLNPSAVVRHRVSAPRLKFSYFASRCYWEGVSKAVVARTVGSQDALSSERSYVSKTLPAAVFRGIGESLRGDFSGFLRSAAVVAGFVLTGVGFVRGRFARPSGPEAPPVAVRPQLVPDPEPADGAGATAGSTLSSVPPSMR